MMELFRLNPNQTSNQIPPTAAGSKLSCCTKPKAPSVTDTKAPNVAATSNGSQHKLTEYFPVRRSIRKTKKTVMEERQRTLEEAVLMCKEEGLQVRNEILLDIHNIAEYHKLVMCQSSSLRFKALCYIISCFFSQIHNFEGKGRGIVARRHFSKGEFVVEYAGELIKMDEAREREKLYAQDQNTGCYMYYFKFHNQQFWSVFLFYFVL